MAAVVDKRKVNKTSKSRTTKGDLLFYICLLVFPLLQIAIFYFFVNINSLLLPFKSFNGEKLVYDSNLPAFKNVYADFLSVPAFWSEVVSHSIIVYLFTSIITAVLAIFFSYYIYKRRTAYKFFKFVLFLPSIIPSVLLVLMFKNFFQDALPQYLNVFTGGAFLNETGFLSETFRDKFVLSYNKETAFAVITAFNCWIGFGSQVLVYTGAMEQIPVEVIEAGKLDGANRFVEFFKIILPFVIPTLTTFIITGIASMFVNQNNYFSFFGGNQQYGNSYITVGYLLYNATDNIQKMDAFPEYSLLGILFTFIVIPLSLLARKLLKKVNE